VIDPSDMEPIRSSVVKFNMQSPPVSPSEYDISMVLGTMQVPRVRSLSTGVVPKFSNVDHRDLNRTNSETRPSPPLASSVSHQFSPNPSQSSPQGGPGSKSSSGGVHASGGSVPSSGVVLPAGGQIDPAGTTGTTCLTSGGASGFHQNNPYGTCDHMVLIRGVD
jgi:hypothetical protein